MESYPLANNVCRRYNVFIAAQFATRQVTRLDLAQNDNKVEITCRRWPKRRYRKGKPADATKEEGPNTHESEEAEDTKEEQEDKNEELLPPDEDFLEDYFRRRTFIFVHHFAGVEDPLTEAMLLEAAK